MLPKITLSKDKSTNVTSDYSTSYFFLLFHQIQLISIKFYHLKLQDFSKQTKNDELKILGGDEPISDILTDIENHWHLIEEALFWVFSTNERIIHTVKSLNIILTLFVHCIERLWRLWWKIPEKVMNHLRCAEKYPHCEISSFSDDTISLLSKEDFPYHSGNKANFLSLVRKKLEQKTCHATYTTDDVNHEIAVNGVNKLLWKDNNVISEDTDLLILM